MQTTQERIENGKKATLKSITTDYNNNDLNCLYFASEDQIISLINSDKISESAFSHWDNYQEELRILISEL